MSNPSMPNIPGMGAMTDTLDFVKNLWGGMKIPGVGIPGMVMPTLSVEEINKQISDLKTVESWLTINMNMLRSTIQALEVQSATIATLQSMGDVMSAAVAASAKPAPAPNFTTSSFAPQTSKPQDEFKPEPKVEEPPASATDGKDADSASSTSTPPLPNPAVWWTMLQDQFKQAVNTALATEIPGAAAKPAASKDEAADAAEDDEPPKESAKAAPKKAAPRQRKAPKTGEK